MVLVGRWAFVMPKFKILSVVDHPCKFCKKRKEKGKKKGMVKKEIGIGCGVAKPKLRSWSSIWDPNSAWCVYCATSIHVD